MVDSRYNIDVPQFQVPNILGSYIAGRQARLQNDALIAEAESRNKLSNLRQRAASGDNSAIRELVLQNPEYAKIFEAQTRFTPDAEGRVMAQTAPSIWEQMAMQQNGVNLTGGNIARTANDAPQAQMPQMSYTPQQTDVGLEPMFANEPTYEGQEPMTLEQLQASQYGGGASLTGGNIAPQQVYNQPQDVMPTMPGMDYLQKVSNNMPNTKTGVAANQKLIDVTGNVAQKQMETPIVGEQAFQAAKAKGEATSYDKEIRTKLDALDEESNALREVIDIYKGGYEGSAAAPLKKITYDIMGGIADVTKTEGLTPEQAQFASDYESIQKLNTLISRAKLKDFGGSDTEKEFYWSSIESPTASNNPVTGIAKAVIGEKLIQAQKDKLIARQEWLNNGGNQAEFERYWNQQMAKKTLMNKLTDFSIEQRLGAPVALPNDSKKAEIIYNAMPEGMQYIHPRTREIRTKKPKTQK